MTSDDVWRCGKVGRQSCWLFLNLSNLAKKTSRSQEDQKMFDVDARADKSSKEVDFVSPLFKGLIYLQLFCSFNMNSCYVRTDETESKSFLSVFKGDIPVETVAARISSRKANSFCASVFWCSQESPISIEESLQVMNPRRPFYKWRILPEDLEFIFVEQRMFQKEMFNKRIFDAETHWIFMRGARRLFSIPI